MEARFLLCIFLIRDFFHPVNGVAVEQLRDGDVRHGRGRRCAMPMFFARRKPDNISGMNCFNRAAFALHASAARSHDQRLPQRTCVPRSSRAGFKRDDRAADPRGFAPLERRVNAHRAGEPIRRSLVGRQRAILDDVHIGMPMNFFGSLLMSQKEFYVPASQKRNENWIDREIRQIRETIFGIVVRVFRVVRG